MSLLDTLTRDELINYIEYLEEQNRELTAKTDNRKKLTPYEVRYIRGCADEGMSYSDIADEFSLNAATVSRIVRRVYYPDVK